MNIIEAGGEDYTGVAPLFISKMAARSSLQASTSDNSSSLSMGASELRFAHLSQERSCSFRTAPEVRQSRYIGQR
jgi:hypothetical protein